MINKIGRSMIVFAFGGFTGLLLHTVYRYCLIELFIGTVLCIMLICGHVLSKPEEPK
jgi:hypothetical protein